MKGEIKPLNSSPCSGSVARGVFVLGLGSSGGPCNKKTQTISQIAMSLDLEKKEVEDGDGDGSSWKPRCRRNTAWLMVLGELALERGGRLG